MSVLMRKPQTLVDVYRLLPEGTPIQVIQNHFYISPSQTFYYFFIARKIFRQLDAFVIEHNLDEAIYAPVDVYLSDKNADLIKKKGVYTQFGVKEYFVVGPSDKTVLGYYLKDGKYAEPQKQNLQAKYLVKLSVFNCLFCAS